LSRGEIPHRQECLCHIGPAHRHLPYPVNSSALTPSEFLEKWSDSAAAERSNAQSFLSDLCAVLNVDPPHAATSDPERDAYVFEKPVTVPHEGRQEGIGFIDLFKRGHFVLEAKQGSEKGSTRLGTARRDSPAWHIAMQDAFGQALTYARAMDAPPPFLIVTDVGHCFGINIPDAHALGPLS
jgi:hypothetical protein